MLKNGEKTKSAVNNSMFFKQPIQLIQFQNSHEGGLGHFHIAYLAHTLLALLLLLQQLALTGDISSVALCQHILAHGLDRLAGDDLGPDGGLNGYLELLTRNQVLKLLAYTPAEIIGPVPVNKRRQSVHGLAVEQDVQLDQVGPLIADDMVVEGGVAAGYGLELVVEVKYYLGQRHVVGQFHTVCCKEMLPFEHTSLVQAELHDLAEILALGYDLGPDIRFLDIVYESRGRKPGRIVHIHHLALRGVYLIRYVGYGGYHVHVELAVQPLLHDLQMKQAEETAAETETQSQRGLGLEDKGGVVELGLPP